MQPQRHRHTDGHTHSMESWGSVCVDVCVLQKDKEVERKRERMRMNEAQLFP